LPFRAFSIRRNPVAFNKNRNVGVIEWRAVATEQATKRLFIRQLRKKSQNPPIVLQLLAVSDVCRKVFLHLASLSFSAGKMSSFNDQFLLASLNQEQYQLQQQMAAELAHAQAAELELGSNRNAGGSRNPFNPAAHDLVMKSQTFFFKIDNFVPRSSGISRVL
jgi:hypothetical protein